MTYNHLRLVGPLVAALFICSCGEDPELVKRHGEQEAELATLRGELALLEERLKNIPEDQSAGLKEAQQKQAKLEAELNSLGAEVRSLEEEKKKLEEDYAQYQRRYVTR